MKQEQQEKKTVQKKKMILSLTVLLSLQPFSNVLCKVILKHYSHRDFQEGTSWLETSITTHRLYKRPHHFRLHSLSCCCRQHLEGGKLHSHSATRLAHSLQSVKHIMF